MPLGCELEWWGPPYAQSKPGAPELKKRSAAPAAAPCAAPAGRQPPSASIIGPSGPAISATAARVPGTTPCCFRPAWPGLLAPCARLGRSSLPNRAPPNSALPNAAPSDSSPSNSASRAACSSARTASASASDKATRYLPVSSLWKALAASARRSSERSRLPDWSASAIFSTAGASTSASREASSSSSSGAASRESESSSSRAKAAARASSAGGSGEEERACTGGGMGRKRGGGGVERGMLVESVHGG
eukprot:scaffold5420_cov64-Isochrysis_galbana.AAC.2